MEIKKLDLLLSKVVEFNQPETKMVAGIHIKGFLYKNASDTYYIKTIDVLSGMVQIGEKINLTEGNEEFITHAEKPKLMRVSMKSWHYRLMKYVMGSNTPTKKDMQNGCPYFWLLMFSLVVVAFVFIGRQIINILLLIPRGIETLFKAYVDSWMDSLTDNDVMEIREEGHLGKAARKVYGGTYVFMTTYISKKYGLTNTSSNEFHKKYEELVNAWEQMSKERNDKRIKDDFAYYAKRAEAERIEALKKAKWAARIAPFEKSFNSMCDSIENGWKTAKSWKSLIKHTKQFFGLIITLSLLFLTYIMVTGFAMVLEFVIDKAIEYWEVPVLMVCICAAIGIIYLLYQFVTGWLENVIQKYKFGKTVWYIQPFIWTIYYPLKYIVVGLFYTVLYIIYKPLEFIFYNIVFKLVLVNAYKFFKALFLAALGSTGIFGEYFGASYSDYCPGIEWTDTEDEEEEEESLTDSPKF